MLSNPSHEVTRRYRVPSREGVKRLSLLRLVQLIPAFLIAFDQYLDRFRMVARAVVPVEEFGLPVFFEPDDLPRSGRHANELRFPDLERRELALRNQEPLEPGQSNPAESPILIRVAVVVGILSGRVCEGSPGFELLEYRPGVSLVPSHHDTIQQPFPVETQCYGTRVPCLREGSPLWER